MSSAALLRRIQSQGLTLDYFGAHVLGPLETNLGGLGVSTLWPPFNPTAIRLFGFGYSSVQGAYVGISWKGINTANGVYDWSVFDAFLTKNKTMGVTDLLFVLGSTPTWAGGGTSNDQPPSSMAYLTTFINAVAARAVSLGAPIRHWEVWNEPNNGAGTWAGTTAQMVTIASTVYSAVHAYDATYRVLTPSCQGYSTTWMDGFLAAGGGAYADIMTFHGYLGYAPTGAPEEVASLINMYKATYATYGQSAKPLWDTEAMDYRNLGVATQAIQLAVYYAIHAGMGVERFYWYSWDQDWGLEWAPSAINAIGVANSTLIDWMVGAVASPPTTAGTVWTVPLVKAGVPSLIVWNSAGASAYATTFAHQTTIAGVTTVVSAGSVTLGNSPILLT
jgi:hypothetical protein